MRDTAPLDLSPTLPVGIVEDMSESSVGSPTPQSPVAPWVMTPSLGTPLVARRHVDLMRTSGAACPRPAAA